MNPNARAATGDSGKLISGYISIRQAGAVTLVGLNRAAKRNALNAVMIAEIQASFQNLPEATRAVILYSGPKRLLSDEIEAFDIFHLMPWNYMQIGDGLDPDLSLTGEAAMSAFARLEGRNMAALLDCRRRRAAWRFDPVFDAAFGALRR